MTPAEEVLIVEPSTAFSNILKQLIFQAHGYHAEVAHDMRSLKSLLKRKSSSFFTAIVNSQLTGSNDSKAIELCIAEQIPTLVFVPNQSVVKELDLWQLGIADYAFKSGAHSLEHIVWSVNRVFQNRQTRILVGASESPEFKEICHRLSQLGFALEYKQSEDDIIYSVHQNPDIEMVVLDCTQAIFDGIGLLNDFRETHSMSDLEIITITDDRNLSGTLLKSGANNVISIPFSSEALIHAINQSADRLDNRKQIKLLQQDKVHLLESAAHDIRSPMSAMKSAAGMLLDKNTPPKRIKPLVDMIEKNASNVLNLIEQLLDLSVLSNGKLNLDMETLDLGKLVEERVALHHLEAETKLAKIKMENHPKVMIKGDRLKLKQIVDTLISNAINSAPMQSVIEISTAQSQQSAFFRVVDSGPEVPREEINNLFKAYMTSSKDKEGNRTGLSLMKKLVDAHKGKIYYTRNKTEQSTFSVEFPIG